MQFINLVSKTKCYNRNMAYLAGLLSLIITLSSISGFSDKTDAALRQLTNSTSRSNNNQLLNLAALRNLRDPDLRPLFFKFTQHPDWPVQVHAVLGLAELSDEKLIDPWIAQQIAPTAREHLVAQSLDDGLMRQEQMEALLKWPLLEDAPKLMLLAELKRLGKELDKDMLKDLATTTKLNVAMFAGLLLDNQLVINDVTRRLRRASSEERNQALQLTLQMIRQYNLKSAAKWLNSIIERNAIALNENERYWTLYTLLTIDSNLGLTIWKSQFPQKPNLQEQVRYLLVLLESNIVPNAEIMERLGVSFNDSLLGLMARAGAINKPKNEITMTDVHALVKLIERSHRDSSEWAFKVAKKLDPLQAKLFYVKLSTFDSGASDRRKTTASQAFGKLIHLDSSTAWSVLHETKDDSAQQEQFLYAMLQTTDNELAKQAVDEASKIKRIGLGRTDIMTLLLMARGSEQLPAIDQKYLGIIAAGGSGNRGVSEPLKTQAAWLYLKRMGLADKALAAASTQ